MKDFYYGKYPELTVLLSTSLDEKPKLRGSVGDPDLCYDWSYSKWVLKENQLVYSGSTSKDPTPEEIEHIISSLSELDPSLNGVLTLGYEDPSEDRNGLTTYVVKNGKVEELNQDLIINLLKK